MASAQRPWSPRVPPTRRTLIAVVAVGAAAWCSTAISFVGSRGGSSQPRVLRQAGYTFGINKAEDHNGLLTAQKDNAYRISTEGSFMYGHWNTVLGDQEIPQSGRSYWEVKFVKKPSNAFEFIGVAEPSSDVTMPLHKNRKGKGWFWGSDWKESFIYTFLDLKPGMNDRKMAEHQRIADVAVNLKLFEKKRLDEQWYRNIKDLWTGPSTHIGMFADQWPTFEKGTVVGIDVDMDDGSLAFWGNGKYLGIVKDNEGKPINLKGKKVVPAMSVFGRNTGKYKENTVMEIRTGLDAPSRSRLQTPKICFQAFSDASV
ncbi:unnamed protein product [Durusdinium trenchii]|uniref:B30.2/SPRY domain-containing protein n=1 Tax=Durusdinium trenchii TaxID=1381693 RepID=A0ABP0HRE7_9DINO